LACFKKLKQAKPEWASAVTQAVLLELKRVRRADDENAIYQELIKEANTISKVQAAMTVAADRKDVVGFTDLFARLVKLQPAVKTASAVGQLASRQNWSSFLTLMGKLASDKRLADCHNVLDLYLSVARRQNLTTPKSASSRRPAQTGQPGGYSVQLYSPGNYYNQTQINFPSPNEYYDQGMITLLYNAFDLHKKVDLLSDLLAHWKGQLGVARGAERLYLQLGLGYLYWWAGEKDEALAQLTEAVHNAPSYHALLLEVASLRELNNELEEGLALLDSFTPLDTQMMQRREDAALRLAERTGNVERARQAAERLFGLRLDSEKQLELADKMHRLGMHDMAETVVNRAQRQAGNKTATLVRVMVQYQNQNQSDLAVQIARQILRKGPSLPNPYRSYRDGDDESARNQAIGSWLARASSRR
jgi:tetratricopeptide (TPR) repeat protein